MSSTEAVGQPIRPNAKGRNPYRVPAPPLAVRLSVLADQFPHRLARLADMAPGELRFRLVVALLGQQGIDGPDAVPHAALILRLHNTPEPRSE